MLNICSNNQLFRLNIVFYIHKVMVAEVDLIDRPEKPSREATQKLLEASGWSAAIGLCGRTCKQVLQLHFG